MNARLYLFGRRHLRRAPPASQGFDELHTCNHLLGFKADVSLLIRKQVNLRHKDVEEWIESSSVPRRGLCEKPLGRLDRGILLFEVVGKDSQRCNVVLNLLKGREHGFPIVCDGYIA